MPNRLIKDSIHTSEAVNAMSDFQFRVWVNLITYVDDFGRGDARPAVIKGTCFPLRDRLTNKDIEAALNALADTGCIDLYEVDGKSYLYFPNWESHQRIRQKVSKFPPPPTSGGRLPQHAADCGEMRPESNPIRIQNPNPESKVVVEERGRADVSSTWGSFVIEYEQNIGLLPTSTVGRGDLEMFFEEYGCDVLREFIHYTARKHPDNPHVYFASLCRHWLGKGITTVEQAKAAFMDYDRRKGGHGHGFNRGDAGNEPYRPIPGETVV